VGLYHCECHFVIREEEDELFWLGVDLEYLQEDPGRSLTGNPYSSAFHSKYLYVKYLDLIDSWNQYANLLANQFRELHEDSPQRRELYASRPPAFLNQMGAWGVRLAHCAVEFRSAWLSPPGRGRPGLFVRCGRTETLATA